MKLSRGNEPYGANTGGLQQQDKGTMRSLFKWTRLISAWRRATKDNRVPNALCRIAWWRMVAAFMAKGVAKKYKRLIRKFKRRRNLVDFADTGHNSLLLGSDEPIKDELRPGLSCQKSTGSLRGTRSRQRYPAPKLIDRSHCSLPC